MLSCLLALTWVKTNQPNKNIYPQKNICLHLDDAPRPQPALGLINTAAGPSLRCFHVSLLLTTNVTLTFFRFTSYFAKQSIFYQYMFSNNESFSTVTSKVLLISLQTAVGYQLHSLYHFIWKYFVFDPEIFQYHITHQLYLRFVHYIRNNFTPLMEEAQHEEFIRCCWKIISASIKYLFLLLDLLSVMSCPKPNRRSGDRIR